MIRGDWIRGEHELRAYRDRVNREIGVEFPLSYLNQGRVRVFRDRGGAIVGGYALILTGPFRTLSSIPPSAQAPVVGERGVVEVTAMWLDRTVRSGLASCQFWYRFSRDLSSQPGKVSYVYAYDLEKTKLQRLYAMARPRVVYQGPTRQLEGMKAPANESIELASCRRIGYLPLYAFPNFVCKLLFERKSFFRDVRLPRLRPSIEEVSHA